jgi:hypothetical protein
MPQFAVRVVSLTRAAEELIKNQVLRNHSANEIGLHAPEFFLEGRASAATARVQIEMVS